VRSDERSGVETEQVAGARGTEAAAGRTRERPRDGSMVVIRPARESDLDALHRIDRQVFGRLAYPYLMLRQLIDVHIRHCMVADDGARLHGYSIGALTIRPKTGWILSLGVLPQSRGTGYGRDLVRETMRMIIADGAREVRLNVDPENSTAIHLYETLGFRITGFVPHYYGPEADRLIMSTTKLRRDSPPGTDRLDAWWMI
jgi:[ribosomal protein S18]-alanine N-acetyltransferase